LADISEVPGNKRKDQ